MKKEKNSNRLYFKDLLEAVEQFHLKFNIEGADHPNILSQEDYTLRHRLMHEENTEYLEACQNEDLIGIADALGDQLYILCGTILKHGFHNIIEDVFNEIQSSNLSKLGSDGKPIYREDVKVLR